MISWVVVEVGVEVVAELDAAGPKIERACCSKEPNT